MVAVSADSSEEVALSWKSSGKPLESSSPGQPPTDEGKMEVAPLPVDSSPSIRKMRWRLC